MSIFMAGSPSWRVTHIPIPRLKAHRPIAQRRAQHSHALF
ncbi:hypothetical protein HBZC1_00650 [Helicobacter bizzozeronii CIII-1]|uniref:Uncharacterized protein n=1 Tax=Helicobacter bizzozeronii (strain CIII-1) TaxID=1002804 RepID=F8KQP7_HELBC|nr:hypothetical protein HBZC1_00650 [Helicobacter bizzozeronii CIII-1]